MGDPKQSPDSGLPAPGVLGAPGDESSPPAIDKEGRATLAAWRARMREGRESVTDWLDANGGGPGAYASTLLECRSSDDDRVRLGALKLEAQLREWFGEPKDAPQTGPTINIDARSVHVESDAAARALALMGQLGIPLPGVPLRAEPDGGGNGVASNGHDPVHPD